MSEIEPKPLDNNLYFEILSFLSQNGVYKKVNINAILNKYFTYEEYGDDIEKDAAIKHFLSKMVSNSHIGYDTVLIKEGIFEKELIFLSHITIDGLIFHIKIQENASILTTNKIAVDSSKTNRYIAFVAVIISFLGMIFSVYNPFRNDEINDLKSQLSRQNTQLEFLGREINMLKNPSTHLLGDKTTSKK